MRGGVDRRWGALMVRLRDHSRAAGDPAGRVDSRMSVGPAVLAAYVVAGLAAVWWQHR
ncbi:MAG: hypothetical protein SYR96_23830 [Actinomycetota bacterium]|nr:hypothetical protein [Actinomycetota bacterium]